MRVLDTAALLYWPAQEIAGGICAVSQQDELERVSAPRYLLVSSLEIDWREIEPQWLAVLEVLQQKAVICHACRQLIWTYWLWQLA